MQFNFECGKCGNFIEVSIKHQHGDTIEFRAMPCEYCRGLGYKRCKGKTACVDYQQVLQREIRALKEVDQLRTAVDDMSKVVGADYMPEPDNDTNPLGSL